MILYSFQPVQVWEKLQQEKTLIVDPELSNYFKEIHFQKCYKWMVEQYSKRIKNGQESNYLWWAWTNRPDLRAHRRFYTKNDVLLKLDVPDKEVLLSHFGAWSFIINGMRVSSSEWDSTYFDYYNCQLPFDCEPSDKETCNTLSNELSYKDYVLDEDWVAHCDELIKDSWSVLFDRGFYERPDVAEWCGGVDDFEQANFEFLKLEYVKKVITFKGVL